MPIKPFKLDVFDKNNNYLGQKQVSDSRDYLNNWFKRPKCEVPTTPLTSALSVKLSGIRADKLPYGGFGYACLISNDPQNSQGVCFLTGTYGHGDGSAITPTTFRQVMVQVAVRKLITPTWLNDRDQFQVPFCDRETYKDNQEPDNTNLPAEFISDCVVYNLFAGHNQTSTLSDVYQGNPFTLDNQFFPYSKGEVMKWATAHLNISTQAQRANETFVHEWLKGQALSPESLALLEAGRKVYDVFYKNLANLMIKKYSLQSWNPGWYQIRNALAEANLGSTELEAAKLAHNALKEKLVPQVYDLGFIDP